MLLPPMTDYWETARSYRRPEPPETLSFADIVDGKLYLNVNADVFQKWAEDVPGNIVKADTNWPLIKDLAPNTL